MLSSRGLGRELVEQSPVGGRESSGVEQVGPAGQGPVQRLGPAPPGDPGVVARAVQSKRQLAGAGRQHEILHGVAIDVERHSVQRRSLADPAIKARFTELGLDVAPRELQTPEGLARFQKAEIDKWWPIIKGANIAAPAN